MIRKTLKLENMRSIEDVFTERQNYSDEHARKLGYPSAEVLRLSDRLSYLAGEWRETKQQSVAHEYGKVLLTMILKGFNVDDLDLEDFLPEELMPDIPSAKVCAAIRHALEQS